jgi:hypothetical protein
MKRTIVLVETTKGIVYELDKPTAEGRLVKNIEFRRDGLTSVNHGDGDHSHYLLTLVNPVSEDDVVFKVIPYSCAGEITFIVTSKEEVPTETATVMKRV